MWIRLERLPSLTGMVQLVGSAWHCGRSRLACRQGLLLVGSMLLRTHGDLGVVLDRSVGLCMVLSLVASSGSIALWIAGSTAWKVKQMLSPKLVTDLKGDSGPCRLGLSVMKSMCRHIIL
mmetsp:Transcript_102583/g.328681  ORF Transcript_102583/g.328681 Transcript_102583/m.328681 type:complete len:120 (-) Transcript_102583:387-746(-)